MAGLPILLDTDVGTDVDDAVAIALLLASPEIDLRAVTTVSGDTALRARIARKLLHLGGRDDVAVAAGIREPILRQRNFLWLGHEGQGIVEDADALAIDPAHAVDLLIDTVRRRPTHVVTIGPLSNLAVALMKEPSIVESISHLTVMGGNVGRVQTIPAVDYNLVSDAEAAQLVLSAGIPTTLVPLDVTMRVFFTTTQLARLRASRSPLVQTLCDAIEVWAPIHASFFGEARTFDPQTVCFLHDPLALTVAFEPSFVIVERLHLRPAIVDGTFQLLPDKDAAPLNVAVEVDAAGFAEFVLQRLASLP